MLEDEAQRLEDDHDEPPGTPPWARSERAGRPGAPLWQVVDLRPEVGASERASIEAALHAAGLLDAWLTPEGVLLDPDTLDTLLRPAATMAQGTTLCAVLSADPAATLDATLIDRLLATMAYRPTAVGTDAPAAIGADGRSSLARCTAAPPKSRPSISAPRRAPPVAPAGWPRSALPSTRLQRGSPRSMRRLRAWPSGPRDSTPKLAAFPSAVALDAALRSLGVAVAVEGRANTEHEQAEAEAARHADVLLSAQAEQREHAVAHGLLPELDDDDLVARREACSEPPASSPA